MHAEVRIGFVQERSPEQCAVVRLAFQADPDFFGDQVPVVCVEDHRDVVEIPRSPEPVEVSSLSYCLELFFFASTFLSDAIVLSL